jgi:cephalosporin-C deacetylase
MLDMPLDQLQQYQGVNPRPADFDAFWDKSIAEMKAIDPKVELIPSADFKVPCADCFDLYFTGVKGARIYAKYLRPKKAAAPHPAIVEFHGYSGNAGDWTTKLAYIALGYSVVSMDCRGQGGKSEDIGGVKGNTLQGHIIRGLDGQPQDLLFRDIFLDTAQLAGIVMKMDEVDPKRVGATGGSQGGALTLACAALEPRIKRLAPMFPFLCDYRRVWDMDLCEDAYVEIKHYFRLFDPQHKRRDEIFTKLGYIDLQHLAPRIRGEVLMATGLMDKICPPSTQFAAYNKITAPKKMAIYPNFGHEGLPGFTDQNLMFMAGL